MAVIRPEKQAVIASLKEKLTSAKSVILVDFRGLTVAQDTKMRRKMREAGVEYRVIKNSLTNIAATEAGINDLTQYLSGVTALAISNDDVIKPAKMITEFAKEAKTIKVKAGIIEGQVVDATYVKKLADMPPREVLIARFMGSIKSPLGAFVRVVDAIAKKEQVAE